MAQINLTMERAELLELIAGDREKALKHLAEKILDQLLLAEAEKEIIFPQFQLQFLCSACFSAGLSARFLSRQPESWLLR